MKLKVKALPIEQIIQDLSKEFKVSIEKDAGEQKINIPDRLGKGTIKGTSFDFGIGVIQYKFTFHEDLELLFSMNKTHPLKFIFCAEGRVNHTFEEDKETHTINTFQNVIVSSSGNNGHILNFKANETVHVFSLEIIRKEFKERKNYNFGGMEPQLKGLFEDSVAEKKFFYQGNYSIKAADIVEEINNNEFKGFLRSMLVEGKLHEMLSLQIAQYNDDQRPDKIPQILRKSDVQKVHQAVELIKNNIDKNYSVEFIAKEVGTNVNKLQDGFKYMFNLTVNKYTQHIKLEEAKDLLEKSDHNISQIVNMIGLNNRSYFSKIFKEKYKVSPKYFLKSANELSSSE